MKQMGLMAYRLSINQPRVLPEGGPVNKAGLDFYDRLVDELLAANIVPYVTLFTGISHALYCRGGWLNPQSPSGLPVPKWSSTSSRSRKALDDAQ